MKTQKNIKTTETITSNPAFAIDWERLCSLPFRRQEKLGTLFKRVYRLIETAGGHPDYGWLALIKEWLLTPYTFWRIPCCGLAEHVCTRIEANERLDAQLLMLLDHMQDLPSKEEQEMMIAFERSVEKGQYDTLIPGTAKYDAMEQLLVNNPRYQHEYQMLGKTFDLDRYRDRHGIIRRNMVMERNFRGRNWTFTWDSQAERFAMVFDNFCLRWTLYGIEGDRPLLQKLTINPTAIGWQIYVPQYWSVDARRDFAWPKFNALQRSRGVQRQGPKMSETRLERATEAQAAYTASLEAKKLKLTGAKRIDYILKKAGLPATTDERIVRRLVSVGKKLSQPK